MLGLSPLAALDRRLERRSSSTKLQIGEDEPWISDKDLARFLDVAPPPGKSPPTPAPGVF